MKYATLIFLGLMIFYAGQETAEHRLGAVTTDLFDIGYTAGQSYAEGKCNG